MSVSTGLAGMVRPHLLVDPALHARDLVARDGTFVAEVEPEALVVHERAALLDVRAEHVAKRAVQEVGRRVVAADVAAPAGVDRRGHRVADGERAALDAPDVQPGRAGLPRVVHDERAAGAFERAGVSPT